MSTHLNSNPVCEFTPPDYCGPKKKGMDLLNEAMQPNCAPRMGT